MEINKSNVDEVMKSEIIISDWDGVLQFIEWQWMIPIKANYDEIFYKFLDKDKLFNTTINGFINRTDYYLDNYLKHNGLELTYEQKELFMMAYTEDPFFYHKCPMLGMFDALSKLSQEGFCSKIIILTQTPFPEGDPRKEYIFENVIKKISTKFELVQIPNDKPKWEYISENDLDFTVFIDDRADIIKDVAINCGCKNRQFWMPRCGYNEHLFSDKGFLSTLEFMNAKLCQYDQRIIPPTTNS